MATTKERNKNLSRPSKGGGAKARRLRTQKRRLVGLGMDPSVVDSLNSRQVLDLLKRPAKVASAHAARPDA
jgi:hypothetical protein